MNLTAAQTTNAWRHWWADHMRAAGGTSRLPLEPIDFSLAEFREGRNDLKEGRNDLKKSELPLANRKQRRQTAHAARRAARSDWQPPEMAEWAMELLPSGRNRDITLEDLLEGLDDYFELFDKLRRVAPDAYNYFATVGTPVTLRNTKIYASEINRVRITNAESLPSIMGAFVSRAKADYRTDIIEDRGTFFDFELFEKLTRNYATVAPPGTVIYRHSMFSLGRAAFSRAELKKYPEARGQWGVSWLIGILPDGSLKALPCQMTVRQQLPSGATVRHSGMMVPPGLAELKNGPDVHVRLVFNAVLAFTTSALSGVQVTMRRRGISLRVGLPIENMRTFFGDREPGAERGRRNQILHLAHPHRRRLANGKEIIVREHLRGERFFRWHDCEITISVPGIHHVAIEGLAAPGITDEDWDFAEYDPAELTTAQEVADRLSAEVWQRRKVKISHGRPVRVYHGSPLRPGLEP